MSKKFEVTCPTCKKNFEYYSSEFRPFCSEKCRLIDLGHWLTESYTVPVQKLSEEQQETLEQILHEKIETEENDKDNDLH